MLLRCTVIQATYLHYAYCDNDAIHTLNLRVGLEANSFITRIE